MIKTFAELPVGARFSVDNIEYIKTETIRVSCCQSINAEQVANASVKNFFADDKAVNINA